MRAIVDRIVPQIEGPDAAVLEEARDKSRLPQGDQDRFLHRLPAFHAIEFMPPNTRLPWPGHLRIAALNAERLTDRPAVRGLIARSGAHATLLSEVDLGMARSGNGHNLRDLVAGTGRDISTELSSWSSISAARTRSAAMPARAEDGCTPRFPDRGDGRRRCRTHRAGRPRSPARLPTARNFVRTPPRCSSPSR